MTPGKPDIDFKLGGAKLEFIYLSMEKRVPSHNHNLGVYLLLSDSTEPVQRGGGSTNLNQCPLVD